MSRRILAMFASMAAVMSLAVAVPPSASALHIAQDRLVNETPAAWTPNVLDGSVSAVVQAGNTTIIGGQFSQVQAAGSTATLVRNNILAFNSSTGALSSTFLPSINGEVTSLVLAADGQSVYVGGSFNNVNGQTSKSLARLNIADGQRAAGFTPPAMNGIVRDLNLSNGRLWAAGTFTTIGGRTQSVLATLDPTTGGVTPYMGLMITGNHNGGTTAVAKFDITPDGSRLVGIGNFTTVDGQRNEQIFMLDLTGSTAALAPWQTNFYNGNCASSFNTYMRDLDISPDGSYFVVSTTGAYGGDNSPCDSITRWATGAQGSDLRAAWVDYPGGDTTYAVAITGAAIYVGGHFRWMNNPFAGDAPGQGAVGREGIAALDPVNGLPLSWNPGRARGVGVFDLLSTPQGLWVASDTDRIGTPYQKHGKIAFFPLAGGKVVGTPNAGSLPGQVYLAGRRGGNSTSNVLYRVDAGGPTVLATDDGPDWAADTDGSPDPHRNSGSNAADWGSSVGSMDSSVPASTPIALFNTERWSPGSPEMHWGFGVAAGTRVKVNLYFANRCGCTSSVGSRVFDVSIDGVKKLSRYDIVGDVGDNRAVMKSFDITSDGIVDIDFAHVTENPLINGIEIVSTDPPPPPSQVLYRVNAGGNAVAAQDNGPVWSADTDGSPSGYRNSGSNATDWGTQVGSVDSSVSASVPVAIFNSERWSPGAPEMHWGFPVAAGTHLKVNLYFANRCSCTNTAGSRSFDVAIDGTTKLSKYDIVGDVGDNRAVMKSFDITSDGMVDIDFNHVVENPLVNGIEIVSTDPLPAPANPDELRRVSYNGTTAGAPAAVASTIPWRQVRGTVMLDGVLYYGLSDGSFTGRTFNGSSFGNPVPVDGQDQITPLTNWRSEVQSMTGLAYQDGRLYFTLAGQNRLYYRFFTPSSNVVGASRFVANTGAPGVDWSQAGGLFISDGQIYWSTTSDGSLHRASFTGGSVGSGSVVSGPATDGTDWSARSMFLYSPAGGVPSNQPPLAVLAANCPDLTCNVTSAGSSDPDGQIVSYAWDFGDGSNATGATASHTYAKDGTYSITLQVTDDRGGQAGMTHPVNIATSPKVAFRAVAPATNVNAAKASITIPAGVKTGDVIVLFAGVNSTAVTVSDPAGVGSWTLVDSGTANSQTKVWHKVATATDAGKVLTVTLSAIAKIDLQLSAYSGVDTTAPIADVARRSDTSATVSHASGPVNAPAGSWVVTRWLDKSSTTTAWTAPAALTVRDITIGDGTGRLTSVLADSGAGVPAGNYGGLVASTDAASVATVVSVALNPAS